MDFTHNIRKYTSNILALLSGIGALLYGLFYDQEIEFILSGLAITVFSILSFTLNSDYQFRLTDVLGKEYLPSVTKGMNQVVFSSKNLRSGIYVLQLIQGSMHSYKIIVIE